MATARSMLTHQSATVDTTRPKNSRKQTDRAPRLQRSAQRGPGRGPSVRRGDPLDELLVQVLELVLGEHPAVTVVEVHRDQRSQIARHLAPAVGVDDAHTVTDSERHGMIVGSRP